MAFTRLYDQQVNPAIPSYAGGGTTRYMGGMQTAYTPPSQSAYRPSGGNIMPRPTPSEPTIPKGRGSFASPYPRGKVTYQAPKVTPFLWNMLGNIKNMDVEERAGYLDNLASGIKDKLDQYGLRLARGRVLTPEQQARYNSLQAAFNDIQSYTTNQDAYDDYLARLGGLSPEEYQAKLQKEADLAKRANMYASTNAPQRPW